MACGKGRGPQGLQMESVPLSGGRRSLGDVWVPSEPGGHVEKLSIP